MTNCRILYIFVCLNNKWVMSEKNPYKYNGDTLVLENTTDKNLNKSVYIESYGCAMNFSDSEIVASILSKNGYRTSNDMYKADLILINTC